MSMPMGVITLAEDGFIPLLRPGRVVVAMRSAEFESFGEPYGSHGGSAAAVSGAGAHMPVRPRRHQKKNESSRGAYALNELPQPHVVLACGFLIAKPDPCTLST